MTCSTNFWILNKPSNLFIAYNDVRSALIVKITRLAYIGFEFETFDLADLS